MIGPGGDWHKSCLTCIECKKTLNSGSVAEHKGEVRLEPSASIRRDMARKGLYLWILTPHFLLAAGVLQVVSRQELRP